MTPLAENVRDYLYKYCLGKAQACPINIVAAWFGTSRRTLEKATEEIRDAGIPLCSSTIEDPVGLYIAENIQDFMPYYNQISHRIAKMSHRRALAKNTLEKMALTEGTQLELFS